MKSNQDHEMKKMRFSDEKKKTQFKKKSPHRPSMVSNYSFVSLSEVTEGSLQVWKSLPEKIRQDPSLASFRQEHERLHGEFLSFKFILRSKTAFCRSMTSLIPYGFTPIKQRSLQTTCYTRFQSSLNNFLISSSENFMKWNKNFFLKTLFSAHYVSFHS